MLRSWKSRHLLPVGAVVALLAALALAGCGGATGPNGEDVALVLDGPPSAVDAGIALAVDRDYGSGNGLALTVTSPVRGGSAVQQLVDGRVQFAVLDIHQLAAATARHQDLVAVAALVQLPYARPTPARPSARTFAPPRTGLPYPQLVIATTRDRLQDDQPTVESLVETLRRGYDETLADPASAVAALTRQTPALDTAALTRQLASISPAFTIGVPAWGDFHRADVDAWSRAQRPPVDDTLAFWFGGGTSEQ